MHQPTNESLAEVISGNRGNKAATEDSPTCCHEGRSECNVQAGCTGSTRTVSVVDQQELLVSRSYVHSSHISSLHSPSSDHITTDYCTCLHYHHVIQYNTLFKTPSTFAHRSRTEMPTTTQGRLGKTNL